jgi:uncharacterized protein YcfL
MRKIILSVIAALAVAGCSDRSPSVEPPTNSSNEKPVAAASVDEASEMQLDAADTNRPAAAEITAEDAV